MHMDVTMYVSVFGKSAIKNVDWVFHIEVFSVLQELINNN